MTTAKTLCLLSCLATILAFSSCTPKVIKVDFHTVTEDEAAKQAETAQAAKPIQKLRILTIGNSFTSNATRYLDEIIEADGRVELVHGKAWIGGSSLERHLRHVREYEADNTTGKPYGGKSLKELLVSDKWDIVTIQQLSVLSDKADTYHPAGDELVAYIRKNAPQAEIWLHETWAYRADDTEKFSNGYTQNDMYTNLRKAYHAFAISQGIKNILPVGDAFQMARRHPDWQFAHPDKNFDYENPTLPELPNQDHSLCLGWFWRQRSKPVKFMLDTHHAGVRGEYLGGCVWFERLFGLSPEGNSYIPNGMTSEEVKFLQKIAHQTVAIEANNKP